VDVADDRLGVADDLALERRQQAQHPVRGGMVRPEVDREQLLLGIAGGDLLPGGLELDLLGVPDRLADGAAHCV